MVQLLNILVIREFYYKNRKKKIMDLVHRLYSVILAITMSYKKSPKNRTTIWVQSFLKHLFSKSCLVAFWIPQR